MNTFKIINDLRNRFWKPKRVINMQDHNGWGNSVQWFDYEKRKIYGFLKDIPNVGDEIQSKMESGNIARFRIIEVRECRDPSDMFFCTVQDVEYLKATNPTTP